ncbi:hypothetical protein [Romboutsia sp. MSSM.1001216sp_RTP31141st1_G3_RTP31141_220114]|uniref:hypothetical protein n=1 Tax=unclassified Romboutsia TaxID=2626894 RepID=UPI0031B6320A
MGYVHEFGIIKEVEENKEYDYNPRKYNCISVNCDVIDAMYNCKFGEKINLLNTFAHTTSNPYKGLAYHGVTLIPTESLNLFLELIKKENEIIKSKELDKLIEKVVNAKESNKWLIHYGI